MNEANKISFRLGKYDYECECPRPWKGPVCEILDSLFGELSRPGTILRIDDDNSVSSDICKFHDCDRKSGNRKCNEECNNLECNFDGGDCIKGTYIFFQCCFHFAIY